MSPWKVVTDQSASLETADQRKTEKPEREPKKYRNTKMSLIEKLISGRKLVNKFEQQACFPLLNVHQCIFLFFPLLGFEVNYWSTVTFFALGVTEASLLVTALCTIPVSRGQGLFRKTMLFCFKMCRDCSTKKCLNNSMQ